MLSKLSRSGSAEQPQLPLQLQFIRSNRGEPEPGEYAGVSFRALTFRIIGPPRLRVQFVPLNANVPHDSIDPKVWIDIPLALRDDDNPENGQLQWIVVVMATISYAIYPHKFVFKVLWEEGLRYILHEWVGPESVEGSVLDSLIARQGPYTKDMIRAFVDYREFALEEVTPCRKD